MTGCAECVAGDGELAVPDVERERDLVGQPPSACFSNVLRCRRMRSRSIRS